MNHAVAVQQSGKLFLESLNYFLVCHFSLLFRSVLLFW